MSSSTLPQILKRFSLLYPKLLKSQQHAFTPDQLQGRMTIQDHLKLCKSLAKSESMTLLEDGNQQQCMQTLADIERAVSQIMGGEGELDFSNGKGQKELFTIMLYVYGQYKASEPERGFLTLIVEILKKAQKHIQQRRKGSVKDEVKHENAEEQDLEINLEIDISLKNDETLNSLLELIHAIIKKLVKLGEATVLQLIGFIHGQLDQYIQQTKNQVFNLDLFAPTSIVYKLLEYLLRDPKLPKGQRITEGIQLILQITFQLFEVYKENSKYFIITVHSSSNRANEDEKTVRRMSILFTDLLDLLVGFCCLYLKHTPSSTPQAVALYHCLFATKAHDPSAEYFTLRERLRILSELNQIFNQVPEIILTDYYWGMIHEGLYEQDQYCRKVSMALLKNNIKALQGEGLYSGIVNQAEFEQLWTTFFDLYDTLESFGTHLTKAVWERSEVFYAFIKKHYSLGMSRLHPLLDFKQWLLVLYKRVQSHMNLKLRRYVQKSTLKRPYMTTFMSEYVFDEFLRSLNKGLLFKDSNIYTQFSSKAEMVTAFYERYFTKECVNLSQDLSVFFRAVLKHVSHPQLMMCALLNLARDYLSLKGLPPSTTGFVKDEELSLLYDLTNSYFSEQVYSSRYLCWKYLLQFVSLHLTSGQFDFTLLLKILGKMPKEFFTEKTRYIDQEGLQHSVRLFSRLPNHGVDILKGVTQEIMTVRAVASGMPKYGREIEMVIEGLSRAILVSCRAVNGGERVWAEISGGMWEQIAQILISPYMTPEVGDSKVMYMSLLLKTVYKYSDEKVRQAIRQEYLSKVAHLVFERMQNHLFVPIQKYEQVQHQPSELAKLHSLFHSFDPYYLDLLTLAISMSHLDLNQPHSSLDVTITTLLNLSLHAPAIADPWLQFLLAYLTAKTLRTLTHAYSSGLKHCLASGQQYFMVSEDLLKHAPAILHMLIEDKPIAKPKEAEGEQRKFLVDNNLTVSIMAQEIVINRWMCLGEVIHVMSFDRENKERVLKPMYKTISEKTVEFLGSSTKAYYTHLFQILKETYIPVFLQRLQSDVDNAQGVIEDYQAVCYQCWGMLKELQTEFDPSMLQEFMEFAFNGEVIEAYAALKRAQIQVDLSFHDKMAREIFDQGNRYWLIMRTALNHLLQIFTVRPHLMLGYEDFIVNFAICREVRSLDSEILLYKLTHLIPQIFPKAYENLNLEEITYQGAYIRTIIMLVLQELIKAHKQSIIQMQGQQVQLNQYQLEFTQAMENIVLKLLEINFDKRYEKASMPYSDAHRVKVRAWQTLVVMLDFVDPNTIYREDLRAQMRSYTGRDIIEEINKVLWKVVSLNHLATVRCYIEIVVIKFSLANPNLTIQDPQFVKTLLDPNVKSTVASSFLVIAGFVLTKLSPTQLQNVPQGAKSIVQLKQSLLQHMSGFLTSNGAHVRCVAQYFMHLISMDPTMKPFIPEGLQPLLDFLARNKDCLKVINRHDEETQRMEKIMSHAMTGAEVVLSTPIDEHGEFLSLPYVERIKEVTSETMSVIRNVVDAGFHPVKRESLWKEELKERSQRGDLNLQVNEASQSNYQRKILPWEQVEYDHELLKRVYESRKRNDIIMCAALIDKVPNLAGLARTSEIMNARCLVINNRAVCDTDEFKGVSVTSEKWLPIYEVQEKDLYSYLVFQKSNGYKILGLEQTANSKMLHQYNFPHKCVMLLGKEKEGIPQQYLSILDECIEIPQFGIIRSLNVHVSGALCLWEYTKQHLPATNSSQRQ